MGFKKLLYISVFFLSLFMCGCDKEKPVILFNNQPINSVTVQAPTNLFESGETTHYVIFNPKGFTSPYLRVQFIKKETKTQNWGFSIYRTADVKADTSKKYYIDYVKITKPGTYWVSVYYLSDLNRPIVQGSFTVK